MPNQEEGGEGRVREGRKGIHDFSLFIFWSSCACVCVCVRLFKKLDNVKCLKKKKKNLVICKIEWCEESLFSVSGGKKRNTPPPPLPHTLSNVQSPGLPSSFPTGPEEGRIRGRIEGSEKREAGWQHSSTCWRRNNVILVFVFVFVLVFLLTFNLSCERNAMLYHNTPNGSFIVVDQKC